MATRNPHLLAGLDDDPMWYKDAIIYELHVRAFYDSNADGIGDFRGLTAKLDYLHDLGITAIWLLPFYPSPLRDDGYDIADYTSVNPSYGTLRDFRLFLREAARRGLRVITELVLNHTSDQHPWFQRARRAAAGSRWRNFYVWHDSPERYQEARIIFKDFETSNWSFDPLAKAYFWHRFYNHQPDLNFTNPLVHKAVLHSMDFWLEMGVSGLRLDAVPYLFEREGTSCENLPETHAFLQEMRHHMDKKFSNRMLLAEANQWPEDASAYFGEGDECHMNFHFPLMPRMFMAVRMEDRQPVIDILQQTPSIPANCQWAMFLRNHDELTLEMVTDEERDYMYRVYAHDAQMRLNLGIRRRLAPLLNNNRRKIELLQALLFALPGTPVLYYGDEIGMGDNFYLGDRNGVRTPMQWSADRNAGFSRANPQNLYLPIIIDPDYHYEAVNVEAQSTNVDSLLWWLKRMIALRKRYKAFGRGDIQFLFPENSKILAFTRTYQDEAILVVANLSRLSQYAALDLSAFQGTTPVELSGSTAFPVIRDTPYPLTLGPYTFYWFVLESPSMEQVTSSPVNSPERLPVIALAHAGDDVFREEYRTALIGALQNYLTQCRWFGAKARHIQTVTCDDVVPIQVNGLVAQLVFVHLDYLEGEPEVYLVPLNVVAGELAQQRLNTSPGTVVARLRDAAAGERLLCDALPDEGFAAALLQAIGRRRSFKGDHGELVASSTRAFRQLRGPLRVPLPARVLSVEQSNSSVAYGDRLILKFFRRPGEGINPDLEINRFLTEKTSFPHSAAVAGSLEYRPYRTAQPSTVAILQAFVPNQGDAWRYTLDAIGQYYERALATPQAEAPPVAAQLPLGLPEGGIPPLVMDTIGPYLNSARLLGQCTAELHIALASAPDEPAFAPEPFTNLYKRAFYQSLRNTTIQSLRTLRRRLPSLAPEATDEATRVLASEEAMLRRFSALLNGTITAKLTRHHGDYHLGQVLYTGSRFVIIDFEGEPARPITERRLKRSPLRDVAGMLRSFHYATHAVLLGQAETSLRPADVPALERWAVCWCYWVSAVFLDAYLAGTAQHTFLPQQTDELRALLEIYLLEKAIYEVSYEVNNRPTWVRVPLQGILQLLGSTE